MLKVTFNLIRSPIIKDLDVGDLLLDEVFKTDGSIYYEKRASRQVDFYHTLCRGRAVPEFGRVVMVSGVKLAPDFEIPGPFEAVEVKWNFELDYIAIDWALMGIKVTRGLDHRVYETVAFNRALMDSRYKRIGNVGNYMWLNSMDSTETQILRIASVRVGGGLLVVPSFQDVSRIHRLK